MFCGCRILGGLQGGLPKTVRRHSGEFLGRIIELIFVCFSSLLQTILCSSLLAQRDPRPSPVEPGYPGCSCDIIGISTRTLDVLVYYLQLFGISWFGMTIYLAFINRLINSSSMNESLNRLLMVNGSWLMAQGQARALSWP